MKKVRVSILTFILATISIVHGQGALRIANLGDFQLESGELIQNLKIGYRTFGTLNQERSNAVLFPTWFTGTTEDLVEWVGSDGLVDPAKYFVVLVDAIGDGVSSSPSNSQIQPRMRFPRFAIRDMVRSQHRLLTEVLKIQHLRAVVGISMGGMQTFQWIVSYPAFVDKAIPIHGSPKLGSYDLLLWTAENRAIQADPAWRKGEYDSPPVTGMKTVAAINSLALTSPEYVLANTSREAFGGFLEQTERGIIEGFDANNWIRQAEAMIAHDVSEPFGGSMKAAAAVVKAEVLVIVAAKDHMVTPQPARQFAELLFAPVMELQSGCGHLAVSCEKARVAQLVARFLEN